MLAITMSSLIMIGFLIIFSIILLIYVMTNIHLKHRSLRSWDLFRFNYLTSMIFDLSNTHLGWIICFYIKGHLGVAPKFCRWFYSSINFWFLKLTLRNRSALLQKIIDFYINILNEAIHGVLSLEVWLLVFPIWIVQNFLYYWLTLV